MQAYLNVTMEIFKMRMDAMILAQLNLAGPVREVVLLDLTLVSKYAGTDMTQENMDVMMGIYTMEMAVISIVSQKQVTIVMMGYLNTVIQDIVL